MLYNFVAGSIPRVLLQSRVFPVKVLVTLEKLALYSCYCSLCHLFYGPAGNIIIIYLEY